MTYRIVYRHSNSKESEIQKGEPERGRVPLEKALDLAVKIANGKEFLEGLTQLTDLMRQQGECTGTDWAGKIKEFIATINSSFPKIVVYKALKEDEYHPQALAGKLAFMQDGRCEFLISDTRVSSVVGSVGYKSWFVFHQFHLLCTFVQLLGEYFYLQNHINASCEQLEVEKMGKTLQRGIFGGDFLWDWNKDFGLEGLPYMITRDPSGEAVTAQAVSTKAIEALIQDKSVELPIVLMDSHPALQAAVVKGKYSLK